MKKLALTLSAIAAIGSAQAEFADGNKLLKDMTGEFGERMHAIGYVTGVFDTGKGILHCAPANVTAGQINDMVKNYLENMPAERHFTGDIIVSKVLKAVWPCAAKKGSNL
jgi:hypothetical protein